MEAFERFWKAYPKRRGSNPKAPAELKFLRHVAKGENPEKIIAGAEAYARELQRDRKFGTEFVAMAQTWLNQRRWEDYTGQESGSKLSAQQIDELIERYKRKEAARI